MKKYLLDTHALIWYLEGSNRISKKSKNIIDDVENQCFVSIVSLWEIIIKKNIGKLSLKFDVEELISILTKNEINISQLTFDHLLVLNSLEQLHKDPFDRIIISQAIGDNFIVITKDVNFQKYQKVNILW